MFGSHTSSAVGHAARKGKGRAALSGAVRLILLSVLCAVAVIGSTGCADVRESAYFPETMTVGGSYGHDEAGGWDRQVVGVSFTWRLKPRFVVPAPTPSPKRKS